MNETPDIVSCPKCDRPILRHRVKEHVQSCVKEKPSSKKSTNGSDKDKVNENGSSGGGKATPNGEIAVMPPKSKKRKLEESISCQR